MAWIKFKDLKGRIYTMPESVFKSIVSKNSGFELVQESKPAPIKEQKQKQEEIVKDEQIQQSKPDEGYATRKSTKKAVS